jgi:hypothetical protein
MFYPYVLENFFKNAPNLLKYLEEKAANQREVLDLSTGLYVLRNIKIDYVSLLVKFKSVYELLQKEKLK